MPGTVASMLLGFCIYISHHHYEERVIIPILQINPGTETLMKSPRITKVVSGGAGRLSAAALPQEDKGRGPRPRPR